jgi:hypothetical protein
MFGQRPLLTTFPIEYSGNRIESRLNLDIKSAVFASLYGPVLNLVYSEPNVLYVLHVASSFVAGGSVRSASLSVGYNGFRGFVN